ncbi:DUF3500 domain-containing protein [uncultured Maricaulis sp.]|uniref:DUF3500 domain-containing protein n=1 Tax=uncultured Maricaulis sp. TaxID=174710 RepID=UPI0026044ED2|nr:DUF3500 domain-containing protein [uncultured Maricaulis sp.]
MKTLILVVLSTLLTGAAHAHPDHAETGMQREAAGMAEAAADFLATLDEDQRARLLFDLDDTEAREGWSNLPTSMAPRSGLQIATLSDAQRIALHGLLARGMSSEGYGEAMHIMTLEPYLRAGVEAAIAERGDEMPEDMLARATAIMESYDPENYWVRIFGDPASGTWSLVLDGHHLAVTATVVDGRIAFTPVFLGNNPQIIQTGLYAGRRSLQHELDRVADLMASLDADQMGQLVQSEDTQDSADFAGPGWVPDMDAAPEGLSATDLNPDQLVLLSYAIREFIGVATLAAGDAQMARIEADGMDMIRLAWWGDYTDLSRRFMLRITGPSLHIDFTRTGGEDRPNHFHIIVRDPSNEYGSDWLQSHYEEAHTDE